MWPREIWHYPITKWEKSKSGRIYSLMILACNLSSRNRFAIYLFQLLHMPMTKRIIRRYTTMTSLCIYDMAFDGLRILTDLWYRGITLLIDAMNSRDVTCWTINCHSWWSRMDSRTEFLFLISSCPKVCCHPTYRDGKIHHECFLVIQIKEAGDEKCTWSPLDLKVLVDFLYSDFS